MERMKGPFSDHLLIEGWYRVDETLELVHEEVEYKTCGTTSPIWAKGIKIHFIMFYIITI
jgi:hypothetical protein